MKTKKVTLYTFDELSPEAQEKAIQKYGNWNVDHDWNEGTYEDAKRVGLKITSFDPDHYCNGVFIEDACFTAHAIIKEHGNECETFKTATAFLAERDEIVNTAPKDEDGELEDESKLDSDLDSCESEFLKSILEDYRIILRKEYEYLTSKEQIIESLKAGYYFNAKGVLESEGDE